MHVKAVLETLHTNKLFVKQSKCDFRATSVVYLGNIISAKGVTMDNNKVEAVTSWPIPKSPRGMRGFFG
jgi:TFIIF-interacting CTD phosphatase-like protein